MGSSTGGSGTQPGDQDDIVQFGGSRRRRRGLSSLLLAVLVAVAGLAVVLQSSSHGHGPPPPPPVTVSDIGHPILGVQAGWELFALDGNGLVRVDFRHGHITRTALPPQEGYGPVSLIVEPGAVIVRPLDNVPGYLVPDGLPARLLTGVLSQGSLLLPGPDSAQAWDIRTGRSISLIGAHGQVLHTRLPAPPSQFSAESAMADGRGDVILFGNAGLEFDAGPGFLRPLGALLIAVGPRTWLGESCDQRSNCTNVVIAAATGSSRALPGPPASIVNWPWPYQPGAVAPDGSTAAVLADGPRGATILELVSLHTGVVTPIAVPVLLQASSQTLAWSPDSQCLFVVTATGRLAVVDPRTGLTHGVSLGLSGLTQIAIRPAGG